MYVTSGVIKEQVDDQKSNFRTEGFSEGTTNETCYTQFSLSQVMLMQTDKILLLVHLKRAKSGPAKTQTWELNSFLCINSSFE